MVKRGKREEFEVRRQDNAAAVGPSAPNGFNIGGRECPQNKDNPRCVWRQNGSPKFESPIASLRGCLPSSNPLLLPHRVHQFYNSFKQNII